MFVNREQLLAYAADFMREVSKVSFATAEAWLAGGDEHFIDIPEGGIPDDVTCLVMAIQEFNTCGKREIELRCGCYSEDLQAIGYVYLADDGTSIIDSDVCVEDAS